MLYYTRFLLVPAVLAANYRRQQKFICLPMRMQCIFLDALIRYSPFCHKFFLLSFAVIRIEFAVQNRKI